MLTIPRRTDQFHPGSRVVVTGPTDTGATGTVETTSPATARVRMDDRERPAVFTLHELEQLAGNDAAAPAGRSSTPDADPAGPLEAAAVDTAARWLEAEGGDGYRVRDLLQLATTHSLAHGHDVAAREYAAAWKLLDDRSLAGSALYGLAFVDGQLIERTAATSGGRR